MTDAPLVNLDAEQAVLGVLIGQDAGWDDVIGRLDPEDFYRGAHRTLYEVCRDMHSRSRPVDLVTVTDELERRGHLEGVGGAHEVAQMAGSAPSWATVGHHVGIVADLGRRRDLLDHAQALARAATDPQRDLGQTVVEHQTRLSTLPIDGDLPILADHQLDQLPPPRWLIEGHVSEGLVALYGPSGAGKSFIALDWALHVVTGRPWNGQEVRRAPALYIAGEGAAGIRLRRDAWREQHRTSTTGFHVLAGYEVDLLDGRTAAQLMQAVSRNRFGVVVLDTLERTMGGSANEASENATPDMSRYISACKLLVHAGATVIVVHHTGLDQTRMRGNTALYAACDTVVATEREEADDFRVKLIGAPPRGKAKDAEPPADLHLRMVERGGSLVPLPWQTVQPRRPINHIAEPMTRLEAAQHLGWEASDVDRLVDNGRLVQVEGGLVSSVHAHNFKQVMPF